MSFPRTPGDMVCSALKLRAGDGQGRKCFLCSRAVLGTRIRERAHPGDRSSLQAMSKSAGVGVGACLLEPLWGLCPRSWGLRLECVQ
jgi:hypothetical protein